MITRAKTVYRLLLAVWAVVIIWQGLEHHWVTTQARNAVIRRARDITGTLGLVIRSQRHWGGFVDKDRLESALTELVQSDLKSIALLNAAGEQVMSAGSAIDYGTSGTRQNDVISGKKTVTVINLVDLGANLQEGTNAVPTIISAERPPPRNWRDGRARFPPPPPGPPLEEGTSTNSTPSGVPLTNSDPVRAGLTNASGAERRPDPRRGIGRPPWMTEERYQALIKERGVHGLAIVLSTDAFRAACTQDLWLRIIIGGFAAVSVVGLALAWQNLNRSSEFQMRLLRASEMNTHLREMNVAAAGLAHETRNPLNIIRGLAQMISKTPDAPETVRQKALEVTDEVDRVTVQLNEFINYSKPREVRRSPVVVGTVVKDVARALNSDLEDKAIKLEVSEENVTVNADQHLLRQVLFNLLLNAIQAVAVKGQIQIVTRKSDAQEAYVEVRDNGPGVPPEQRKDIFRPYFTTRTHGTGLGLAVVKQIALVHGWEVECLSNNGQGAVFRVGRLELSSSK
jgi:signal transduction histidine kinase